MVVSANGEEEAWKIRGTQSQGEYILDSNLDREFRPDGTSKEGQSFGSDRNDGSSRTTSNNTGERITGEIIGHLIRQYREQVASNKVEITQLEAKIHELETLRSELEKRTDSDSQ